MGIAWFNIRSKEIKIAESEPMIAAMYNSSDMGKNVQQGQDFGWRLHPSVVIQLKGIKGDPRTLESIAVHYQVSPSDIDDKLIIAYINDRDRVIPIDERAIEEFEDEYRNEIKELEARTAMAASRPMGSLDTNSKAGKR